MDPPPPGAATFRLRPWVDLTRCRAGRIGRLVWITGAGPVSRFKVVGFGGLVGRFIHRFVVGWFIGRIVGFASGCCRGVVVGSNKSHKSN